MGVLIWIKGTFALDPSFYCRIINAATGLGLLPDTDQAGMSGLVVRVVEAPGRGPKGFDDQLDGSSGIGNKDQVELGRVGSKEGEEP